MYVDVRGLDAAIRKYLQKNIVEPQAKAEEEKSASEEAAAKAELDRVMAEQNAMQQQIASDLEAGKQQIAKSKQEAEGIQRETGERKLSRVRARVRSLSRPMLSKGVSL